MAHLLDLGEPAVPPDYVRRAARLEAERARLDAVSRGFARARLMVAAGAAAAVAWAWPQHGPARWLPAGLAIATFVALAWRHARADQRAAWLGALAAINRDAAARCRREWNAVIDWQPVPSVDPGHPYQADLDVTGHASLMRLLGRARTSAGDRVLGEWLLTAGSCPEILSRQAAARALGPHLDWRQSLAAHALAASAMRDAEFTRFVDWCGRAPWLRKRPWLYVGFVTLTVATPLLLLLAVRAAAGPWWVGSAAIGLLVSLAVQRPLTRSLEDASWQAALRGWRAMFELVSELPPAGDRLGVLRARLSEGGTTAAEALDQLDRIVGFASLRHTPVLHWPLHLLTMYDAHVWWALEGWQQRHGARLPGWVAAVAEVEALSALAGLAHDHPGWTWPAVQAEHAVCRARALAHPLIAPDRAVANDVTVGPPGTLLLVTGSNMSGKSTLLRAVGLNAVLAQAGGPVCAAELVMPPLRLFTSMRIADSLEDGVSYFMASLRRLKMVVEGAAPRPGQGEVPLMLYLLDELLSGTNTAERETAVRAVLVHLLASPAIGAVTSHDLTLADAPELSGRATLVHFRETIEPAAGRMAMSFDYRLRDGVASSRNALALMELVGLRTVLESRPVSEGRLSPPGR